MIQKLTDLEYVDLAGGVGRKLGATSVIIVFWDQSSNKKVLMWSPKQEARATMDLALEFATMAGKKFKRAESDCKPS